ncbi:hypothetical protein KYC5002_00145 [Archangium violaceum]|uniref:hypothetical protein n=1 Tax=Archangium violaceum TaxID=83451 RepID=UPI002B2D3E27|nr:hypothetical protein KYC5002_00145 [Archangium gephyra]
MGRDSSNTDSPKPAAEEWGRLYVTRRVRAMTAAALVFVTSLLWLAARAVGSLLTCS